MIKVTFVFGDETCELCSTKYRSGGDGWDGLCPTCADRVSDRMDQDCIDRDAAIELIRQDDQDHDDLRRNNALDLND